MKSDLRMFVFGVGALTIAVMAYYLASATGANVGVQAKYEPARQDPFAGLNAHILLTMHSGENQTTGHEWRRSDFDPTNQSCVNLPVRYPAVSGSPVSAVIHHGWSSLMKPASCDNDWAERPPAEVMW